MSKRKSYFNSPTPKQEKKPVKGDLNGDGKVDWVDSLIGIVTFIQTPRGQAFIVIAAAVFSAAINIGSYTKTTALMLDYLQADWLLPFSWLVSLLIWGIFQVGETLPRTGFWDFETKVAIVKSLQGAGVPISAPMKGQQTDLVYWQDVTINDAKMRRRLFWMVSLACHAGDFAMLWPDYPLVDGYLMPIVKNLVTACFLVFSFEVLVGIAQSIKQLKSGYAVQSK